MRTLLLTLTTMGISGMLMAQNLEKSISGETNNLFDEGEAHIVMSPADPSKMAVGYMESGVGPVVFKIFHSEDGGNSWNPSTLNTQSLALSEFPFLDVVGGGDILLSYDKQGKLYASWIHLMGDPSSPGGIDSIRWLSFWASSLDNGKTFTIPPGDKKYFGQGKISIRNGTTVQDYRNGITDRQWMVTDLSNGPYSNRLYMGFINYTYVIQNSGLRVITKDPQQTEFSNYSTAYSGSGQFTNLAIDSQGVLHYTFCDVDSNFIYHVSSNDGGKSFTTPHLIYEGKNLAPTQTYTHRRENAAPSLTIDGQDNLHLVWADFDGNSSPLSFYSRSTDQGASWSTPLPLDNLFLNPLIMPVVTSFGHKLTIGANVLNSNKEASYQQITSTDYGQSFGTPVTLSSGVTDMNQHFADFHGDYTTSLRTECEVYSLWTDCRSNNCVVYLARYNDCDHNSVTELIPLQSKLQVHSVFPNPAKDLITLNFDSQLSGEITLTVYDMNGKKYKQIKENVIPGNQDLQLSLTALPAGQYLLQLTPENGAQISRRIVKE